MLQEEFERAKAAGRHRHIASPKRPRCICGNADGISIRVKAVLARAFEQKEVGEGQLLAAPTSEEVRRKCLVYMAGQGDTTKANRMRVVLSQYLDGASIDAIVKDTGYGQGTVSAYLNEIQKGAGVRVDPDAGQETGIRAAAGRAAERLRRASIRDFHSFRVTWITLALAAGVPLGTRPTRHRAPDPSRS